jgi:hypothetical protein
VHQSAFAPQAPQHAEDLVLAAEIGEFTRKEDILACFASHPRNDFVAQCLSPSHDMSPAKTRHLYMQKPDIVQWKAACRGGFQTRPYTAHALVARMSLKRHPGGVVPPDCAVLSSGRAALRLSGEIPLNMLNS